MNCHARDDAMGSGAFCDGSCARTLAAKRRHNAVHVQVWRKRNLAITHSERRTRRHQRVRDRGWRDRNDTQTNFRRWSFSDAKRRRERDGRRVQAGSNWWNQDGLARSDVNGPRGGGDDGGMGGPPVGVAQQRDERGFSVAMLVRATNRGGGNLVQSLGRRLLMA
jgi:hypothetical protein